MTNKIKVNKKLGEALSFLINNEISNYDIARGFSGDKIFHHPPNVKALKIIKKDIVNVDELYSILLNRYEVDLTKEDRVLEAFQDSFEIACTTPNVCDQWRANGFMGGIRYMNEIFELGLDLDKK